LIAPAKGLESRLEEGRRKLDPRLAVADACRELATALLDDAEEGA